MKRANLAPALTSGRTVGVDLWRTADQSGNSAEAAATPPLRVVHHVELHTGDMTV
jgi:hypothetical protein